MMWAPLVFLLIGSAAAQVPKFGACPNVSVKQDFDVTKFAGKWFEAQEYFTLLELGIKCKTATFTANANGTVTVLTQQISTITSQPSSYQGYATKDGNEKAKLSVVFPSLPLRAPISYWVVDTDYDSYAVVWSCKNVTVLNARSAWLLTREQQPAKSVLEKALAVFDKNGLDRSPLRVINQINCPKN